MIAPIAVSTTDVPPVVPRQSSAASIVIASVMVVAALRLGREFVLPVVISVLLTLLLSAPVRWLRRRRVSERIGAALVVFGALGVVATTTTLLMTPAIEWVTSAPAALQEVEAKVRKLAQPLARLQQSADRIERATAPPAGDAPRPVQLATPGLFARASMRMLELIPSALTVVFLTYFLLASAPLFRRKLVQILPGRRDVKYAEQILTEVEIATSRYLVTATLINTGVGVATGVALWAVGMPNAILWGLVAAVLNFVPYLGPVVTATVIGLAALAGLPDPGHAMLAPAAFLLIHLFENNFITPTLLGRRLPVSTVSVFLGLLFFSWVWGIPGAVLAVPLTVVMKIACDHIPGLHHVGALLDS